MHVRIVSFVLVCVCQCLGLPIGDVSNGGGIQLDFPLKDGGGLSRIFLQENRL